MDEHTQERRRNIQDRRRYLALSEEEVEIIVERVAGRAAEKAADLVFERIYGEVGKGVLKRIASVIIIAAGIAGAYFFGTGHIK